MNDTPYIIYLEPTAAWCLRTAFKRLFGRGKYPCIRVIVRPHEYGVAGMTGAAFAFPESEERKRND